MKRGPKKQNKTLLWLKVVIVTWVNSGHKPYIKPLMGTVFNSLTNWGIRDRLGTLDPMGSESDLKRKACCLPVTSGTGNLWPGVRSVLEEGLYWTFIFNRTLHKSQYTFCGRECLFWGEMQEKEACLLFFSREVTVFISPAWESEVHLLGQSQVLPRLKQGYGCLCSLKAVPHCTCGSPL